MSMIDDIKRDRDASAAGEWTMETVATSCGVCHKVGLFPSNGVHKATYICVYEDHPPTTAPSKIKPIASRIARTSDMEAALIAAEEMAIDMSIAADNARHAAKTDPKWEGVAEKLMARVNAYRAATGAA